MKKLYEFSLDKFETKNIEEKIQNDDGSITITQKTEKVNNPVSFFIKKPTRSLYDSEELFRSWCFKDAVQTHGLIPQSLLIKRITEDEGILSKKEKEDFQKQEIRAREIAIEINKLKIKETKSDDDLKQIAALSEELSAIWLQFESLKYAQQNIYHNTAEAYVSRRVVRWWILNLAYNSDNTPYFGEGNYDKKTEKFYELDDSDDEFTRVTLNAFTGLIGMWCNHGFEKQEDFDKFFKEYISQKEEEKETQKDSAVA